MDMFLKPITIILGALALASCSESGTPPETVSAINELSANADTIMKAADGQPPYGTFDVTAPDGQVYREVIRPDGTFSSSSADGSAVEGEWEQRAEGVFCSRPIGAPDFRCKNETVNDQGVWTSTEINGGEVSIVKRVAP